MPDEQFLTSNELSRIYQLQELLNRLFNPTLPLTDSATICPDDIKLMDSNGDPVGTVSYNYNTKGYVFRYPAPEDT